MKNNDFPYDIYDNYLLFLLETQIIKKVAARNNKNI